MTDINPVPDQQLLYNWIKNKMLTDSVKTLRGDNIRLLDLSPGRGSDILKWMDAGVSRVVGIDSDKKNIEKASDRYNRYRKKYNKCLPECEFHLINMRDPESLKQAGSIIRGKFDIVTCNNRLHEYFGKQDDLDTLLKFVRRFIKPDGLFIGTSLSSDKMNRNFVMGDTYENSLFRLTDHTEITDSFTPYGNRYTLELPKPGIRIEGYKPDQSELTKRAERHRFELIEQHGFSSWNHLLEKNNPGIRLPDDDRELSRMFFTFSYRMEDI